jgi:CRP-like cAMP-binding protein
MYEQRIKEFPLFSVLPQSEIRNLSNSLNSCEFEPGAIILEEGGEGVRFFILIEGEVEIIKALGTSDERLLAVRGAGSFLGEMSLLSWFLAILYG